MSDPNFFVKIGCYKKACWYAPILTVRLEGLITMSTALRVTFSVVEQLKDKNSALAQLSNYVTTFRL